MVYHPILFFYCRGNPFVDHQPREGGKSRPVCEIRQAGVALAPRGSTNTTYGLEYPLKAPRCSVQRLTLRLRENGAEPTPACPGRHGPYGPRPLPGGIAPGVINQSGRRAVRNSPHGRRGERKRNTQRSHLDGIRRVSSLFPKGTHPRRPLTAAEVGTSRPPAPARPPLAGAEQGCPHTLTLRLYLRKHNVLAEGGDGVPSGYHPIP